MSVKKKSKITTLPDEARRAKLRSQKLFTVIRSRTVG